MSLRDRLTGVVGEASLEEAAESRCRSCGATGLVGFYEAETVPAQTCVLLDSRPEAEQFPTGSLLLGLCESCGFIQNTRFDLALVDYSMPTEESQAFSPKFTEFASRLADDLVARHDLEGKTVLEVGCGKGDFLQLLADRGIGSGTGIDPGYLPNRDVTDERLEYLREWFGPDDTHRTADFVLSRHLMEHVPNVGEFFGWLRESTERTPGAVLFTEVPDTSRVLREGAFWDVYHEHCSYFTGGSLARALRTAGMSVHRLEYGFDDQYLLAESQSDGDDEPLANEDTPRETAALVERFAGQVDSTLRHWRERIAEVESGGGTVAVWGGGSKAVAFVTTLGLGRVTVVDINPHKQGKWLPGTRVEVERPDVLRETPPDLVIPMNPIYVPEIERDLADMGLTPEIEAL